MEAEEGVALACPSPPTSPAPGTETTIVVPEPREGEGGPIWEGGVTTKVLDLEEPVGGAAGATTPSGAAPAAVPEPEEPDGEALEVAAHSSTAPAVVLEAEESDRGPP